MNWPGARKEEIKKPPPAPSEEGEKYEKKWYAGLNIKTKLYEDGSFEFKTTKGGIYKLIPF